jgi:uncharacterized membrane protein YeaQ/YmgE (transglycosylase-associated protein family)
MLIPITGVPLIAGGDRISFDLGSILWYALVGLIIGVVARLIVPGTTGMSWLVTLVVGVLGAAIGGWLAGEVFEETEGVDWIASILVAVLLVWLVSRSGYRRRPL